MREGFAGVERPGTAEVIGSKGRHPEAFCAVVVDQEVGGCGFGYDCAEGDDARREVVEVHLGGCREGVVRVVESVVVG